MNQSSSSNQEEPRVKKVEHVEVECDSTIDIVKKDGYIHLIQEESKIYISEKDIKILIEGLQLIQTPCES